MQLERERWLLRQYVARPRLRLFCFSHAGGSAASYFSWQAALGPDIEVCAVQLPGRGARLGESPMQSLESLVAALAHVTRFDDGLPFAYFGHSLGALVAFELARYQQHHGRAMPERLFVSGSSAPRRRMLARRLHELDDASLIAALRQYNGVPAAVLDEPELMALMLPTVRADFALVAHYHYSDGPLLSRPLTVLGGIDDPHVPCAELRHWQEESSALTTVHTFPGDHFFVQSAQHEVLACLRGQLNCVPACA